MFGGFGMIPYSGIELDEKVEKSEPNAEILPGDIVEVATRWWKPVLAKSKDFDNVARLRVLGAAEGDHTLYVMLVTSADVKHIQPNTRVDSRMLKEYGIEKRFLGEEAIVVTDTHLRAVVKQQRGRWCEKCDEYNEDVRTEYSEVYFCTTCRENPWR